MNLTDIFLKVVDMSLTASWVALAVLVLRFVLKKAPKWLSCLLWVLVAFRLVCPVSFESALSLVSVEGARDVTDNILDSYVGPSSTYWDITEEYDAAVNAGIEPIHGGEGHYYVVTGETPTTEAIILADDVAVLWVAGIGAMVVYGAVSYFRLRRKVAASLMTEQGIYLCDYIDTPFILGIIRPRIYLPSNMEPDAAAHVIAHERAHLNRKDHWWKPLGYLLLTVHWFNPVIWLAYILLCRDIELACDEKVIRKMEVGEKKAYSQALLACSVSRHRIAACPLAFGEVGVGERVKSVLNYKKPTFWIILIAMIALVVGAVCFLTDPVSEDTFPMSGSNVSDIDTQQVMKQIRKYNDLEENQNAYMNSWGFDILLDENFDFASASVQYFFYKEQKTFSSILVFVPLADSFCLLGTEEWQEQDSIFLLEHYLNALRSLPQKEIRAMAPKAERFLVEHVEEGTPGDYERVIRYSSDGVGNTNGWLIHLKVVPAYMEAGTRRDAQEEAIHLFYGDADIDSSIVVDLTLPVKTAVEDYLQNGSPYLTLLESDIRILEAIDWEKLEFTGSASDSKSTGYVFTVWEPMVIDGKVEEYYHLSFEIDIYGNLIGFSKSAPERMADTLSLYELCQVNAEDVTNLDYSALYFENAYNDRDIIEGTIDALKKINIYATPVEDKSVNRMISEVSMHLLCYEESLYWHFEFDPLNGYVGVSKSGADGNYGFNALGVYELVDSKDVEKLYSAIGYDRDRYFAFPYHVGEDGTLSPIAENSEAELYLSFFLGTYYDGTEIPGYVSVDDSERTYLMQLMREIPESAWEDGAREEDYGEFRSDVYLDFGETTEAYLFCTDGGVNLKFYRDGNMLEKTYHIRYAPLNEFIESICNKSRRDGNIRIWYPEDDLVEYTHEDVTIALQPMVGWEFEVVPYTDDSTPFGIRCHPEWEEEGWLFVSYWHNGFATCGTGLETREWQWSNFQDDAIYDVTYGYFDGSENWSYIWFTNLHGDYVIMNEGADAWFQWADDISFMVMGSDGEGLIRPIEENDLQQTHEQITEHSSKDSSEIVDMIDKLRDAADGTPAR